MPWEDGLISSPEALPTDLRCRKKIQKLGIRRNICAKSWSAIVMLE